MLDNGTKRKIDNARNILVGKVPDPKSQVEQITIALIYKFMDDMDKQSEEWGGEATFFSGKYKKYSWSRIFDPKLGGFELINIYGEALIQMNQNPNIPQLFRDIFKNAYLPYRDPETLKSFLKEINEFKYDHSEQLGNAYEYLLSVLSSQGDAGQFRTPRHIIDFIVEIVRPEKKDTVLDPACGTAGFLISSYKYILNANADKHPGDKLTPDERKRMLNNFIGYDISPDMARLSLVNMYLHGFADPNIVEYDALTSEARWNDTYDVIFANPPFMSPRGGIRPHKRFSIQAKRSEVLFVDYIAEHLNPNGRAGVIVPEGIIFQSQKAYKNLRKMLVEDCLWAVVSLPAGIFNPYSGVKTSILLMDKGLAKKSDSLVFVKIENDGYDLGAQRRAIDKNDLPGALEFMKDAYTAMVAGQDVKEVPFAHIVDKGKIVESGEWGLSSERYKTELLVVSDYEWYPIQELTDLFVDGNWVERKDQAKEGIRLVQTGNVGKGEYLDKIKNSRYISENKFIELKCTEVYPGDVLISRLPDPVGRACIVPDIGNQMITAVDCTIVRFNKNKMLPSLFINYTKTDGYYKNISQYLTGASRRRISRSNLAKVKIPVPPLKVQKSIVAEIDTYQKIIDGARQVVDNYKPSFKIDPEWDVVELKKLCQFKRGPFGGALKKEIFVKDGYKVYEQKHAIKNNFEIGTYYITSEKFKEMKPFAIKTNDLIISCSGTMGKIAIVPEQFKPGIINQALLKLTPAIDKVLPIYIKNILESDFIQNKYFRNTSGAAIQNVASVKVLKSIKIPFPQRKVQKEIISKLKTEQEFVNGNKQLIDIYEQKIKDKIAEVWGE